MRSDLSDITVVLDRSGSMQACKADAEVGLNAFIRQQAALPGEAIFSLVQFDNVYEVVHSGVNLKNEIPFCSLEPRHGTALLDAVGSSILETGHRLQGMPEESRPGLVVFVIVTDGEENASRHFTRARVKHMIERQRSVYSWQFTFLGANQDAFAEAGGIGIAPESTIGFDGERTCEAMSIASDSVSRMREMSASGTLVTSRFTGHEREQLAGPNRRIRLRGLNGDIEGRVWESDSILRAGRREGLDIVLSDTSVSRRHAELRSHAYGWLVRDLGSTNGTFVNGTRLGQDLCPVRVHDILRCGNVTFAVDMVKS